MTPRSTARWAAFVALALLIAACGDSDTSPSADEQTPSSVGDATAPSQAGGHEHSGHTNVSPGAPVPTIALTVEPDAKSGWNLRAALTDFTLAPERVSTHHIEGEGHMHLYIDGQKITRLYGEWFHLDGLDPGEHHIRVELSANDHSALAVDGTIIDAEVTIEVQPSEDHGHGQMEALAADAPTPEITARAVPDPKGGHNLQVELANHRLAPEHASSAHVAGEGHMHLYIDGEKIARLYSEWYRLPTLESGQHEIRVELNSNDHRPLTVDGAAVESTFSLVIEDGSEGNATSSHHDAGDEGHDENGHDDGHGHDVAETPFDAEVADATTTIEVTFADGSVSGVDGRVEVEQGSVVAIIVTSDTDEQVHVHGYDIVRDVRAGGSTQFAFRAEIGGVFEVEMEKSDTQLVELAIS